MHKRSLTTPDGRLFILYGSAPIPEDLEAPAARPAVSRTSHLRWHPLLGEWILYATRAEVEGAESTADGGELDFGGALELPGGAYEVAVVDDPTQLLVPDPPRPPSEIVDTAPARGASEVVVQAREPGATLASLPLSHLEMLLDVWADRYRELGARPEVKYVLMFEDRRPGTGGLSLGRIHAYPFIPTDVVRELRQQRIYFEDHDRGLLEDHITAELEDGRRVLHAGPRAVAIVPVCARSAHEVWIAPRRPAASVAELVPEERVDLARALKIALAKLHGLKGDALSYVMALHQAPTDGSAHPEAHFHIQVHVIEDAIEGPSAIEVGARVCGETPERGAAELQAVEVALA